ncbi:unnamed protein product [Protopolystoma xenopodis]|uniref:Uncharacterized protein n=1 Tax=Protopolystoma xenopodis TaxID=117903 RepID=A0A448XQA2_9PLAT|nr:unnamed protein product [Protopolystoma xenopodis]
MTTNGVGSLKQVAWSEWSLVNMLDRPASQSVGVSYSNAIIKLYSEKKMLIFNSTNLGLDSLALADTSQTCACVAALRFSVFLRLLCTLSVSLFLFDAVIGKVEYRSNGQEICHRQNNLSPEPASNVAVG